MSALLSTFTGSEQRTFTFKISVDKYTETISSQASSLFALGTWHRDGSPLEAALADVADRCPELMPLARFLLPRLPRALLCSNNLKTEKASSRYMPMSRAVRRKWMGLQAREQNRINVMVIDCDGPNWRADLDALIARGLPPPSFIVRSPVRTRGNKRTGQLTQDRAHETAHLYWVLGFPVKKSNAKAYDLFTRTRAGLVRLLSADPAAAGHLGKNPFHAAYLTEVGPLQPVELLDLCRPMQAWCAEGEYFLPERIVSRDGGPQYRPDGPRMAPSTAPLTDGEAAQWGKLFEARHGIYAERTRDYGLILATVEEHAEAVGSRASPQDMRHTARSIHRFMVRTYAGAGKRPGIDHGVMTREYIERGERGAWVAKDKTEKRTLAAKRTNEARKSGARASIAEAAMRLWAADELTTQVALAGAAGVSESTVRRLWDDPEILIGLQFSVVSKKPVTRSYQGFTHEDAEGVGAGPFVPTLRALAAASRARSAAAKAEASDRQTATLDEERRAIGLARPWRDLAKAMLKPGAMARPVPVCPAGSPSEVRAAREEALAAQKDARRRLQARKDRAAAKAHAEQRRQIFTTWAKAGNVAAWNAWMEAEDDKWDWMLQSEQGSRDRTAKLFMRRAVAFKRYRAEWKTSLTLARHKEDVAYWRAVRQRKQPIVIMQALDSADMPPTPRDQVGSPEPSLTGQVGTPNPSFIRDRVAQRMIVPAIHH